MFMVLLLDWFGYDHPQWIHPKYIILELVFITFATYVADDIFQNLSFL
jgi:hypothetical protein